MTKCSQKNVFFPKTGKNVTLLFKKCHMTLWLTPQQPLCVYQIENFDIGIGIYA